MMRFIRFRPFLVTVAASAFLAAGCGGDSTALGTDAGVQAEPAANATSTFAPTTTAASTTVRGSESGAAVSGTAASTTVAAGSSPGAPGEAPATTLPPSATVTTVAPPPSSSPPPPPPTNGHSGKPCIVSLHGKGGGGQGEWTGSDGVRHSFPGGNASGWGGRQWLYYPEGNYQAARAIVANDIAAGGCGRVVVYGFSNGAAFAAKLYCRGETFGGRIVGYVIDDPVVDHAVEGCARPGVRVVIYWTGAIDQPDGWNCGDWTCEGGTTIGIARYQAAVGVAVKPSIYTTHRQYHDPPELQSWL
jgi:hypothetical protein